MRDGCTCSGADLRAPANAPRRDLGPSHFVSCDVTSERQLGSVVTAAHERGPLWAARDCAVYVPPYLPLEDLPSTSGSAAST